MTTPVSNANCSSYDRNAQLSSADSCDSSTATCGPTEEGQASAPHELTIPPVVISGDAGAQQLVKQLDEARLAPDCSLEAKNAAHSCAKAGLVALSGGLAATTVVGALPGLAATFFESISCGKDLRAYYDCENP